MLWSSRNASFLSVRTERLKLLHFIQGRWLCGDKLFSQMNELLCNRIRLFIRPQSSAVVGWITTDIIPPTI